VAHLLRRDAQSLKDADVLSEVTLQRQDANLGHNIHQLQ
jgi:hypothetical protein